MYTRHTYEYKHTPFTHGKNETENSVTSFFIVSRFILCVHSPICMHSVCHSTCVEVKGQLTQELVLSFHLYMGSRIQLRSSPGLAASILDPLSHLASSLEILFFFLKKRLFIYLICTSVLPVYTL